MSLTNENPDAVHLDPMPPFNRDTHYQHLMSVIPHWLTQATPQKREALRRAKPRLPAGLNNASRSQHAQLRTLNALHWQAQNSVDQSLAKLKNASAFAEPLLVAALKERFGLELNVHQTFLRLYIPAHIPWLRLKSGAARIWTVSLLDAALHNFEIAETRDDAFETASTYISPPSPTGQFNELRHVLSTMPITAFTRLCRELDIGERYKKYLEDNLGISNPVVASLLQPRIRDSQKAALAAALHMAKLQSCVGADTQRLIQSISDGLHGQSWFCHELTLMNARLTGIVLFGPKLELVREATRVVAYIPDDPKHPIKEYPSTAAFAQELIQRLRTQDYQTFFSRFIDHQDRGHFFGQLKDRLAPITWQPVQPGDARPTWRENPGHRANLQIAATPINGDLWVHLYRRKLDKILNDARVIAVSTATVDQKARWALWDSFSEIASALINIVAFVALPFVPFLGELMLAYMAYQLLDETFESIVDWAEGLTTEAFEHFMGVVESAVQLGTFAAGGVVAAGEFRALLPLEIVQFIDRFHAVKTPTGERRYWKPDLSAYEQPGTLPHDARPDTLGLYRHNGKTLLSLDDKPYAVSQDSVTGEHRIDHPNRPEAYKPVLKHNGAGAWQTELDQPLSWDQSTVLRRIGPDMERFAPSVRERMLQISGCHENALRKMHVETSQVPALLADTLKRFKIDQDIQTFIERIGSEQPNDYLNADPITQLELLCDNGYWPADKGLRLVDNQAQTLWEGGAVDQPVVQITQAHLGNGDLIKTLLLNLGETETRTLMGESFGAPSPSLDSRARTLRRALKALAESKRETLFDHRYRQLDRTTSRLTQKLIDAEHGLPSGVADALLQTASDQELQQLERGTLSKRLEQLTREARLQVRITRAYEGLEIRSSANNLDTDRLALHTLERLPGWSGQLRLEIREYAHGGHLLDRVGNADAPIRKVLVLNEDGSYQAYDDAGLELGDASTFYLDLLQALPDSERSALGLHIGEGEKLNQLIRTHALSRDELQSVLAQHLILKPTYDPTVMRLLGGIDGYHRAESGTPTLQARAHALFPQLSVEELQAFVERLQRHPTGPRAELSRFMAEHARYRKELYLWRHEIPLFVPDTQTRVTPDQFRIQQQNRRRLVDELFDCWRQQASTPTEENPVVELRFSQPILGELPVLGEGFSHVTALSLDGHTATRGMHDFLRGFSNLRRLALRGFRLNQLPHAIVQSPNLTELILSDCAITLTPESHASLSALNKLTTLDLYKNPLGFNPTVENMPLLNYIDVSDTGISGIPPGLLTRPHLRTALLNDNHIQELPAALFDLPTTVRDGFDLGDNPLSAATRERIKSHFSNTRQDFGVFAEQADINRVQALYPRLDQEEASEFVYLLPGTLADGSVEITRLETELIALGHDLSAWTANVPAVHPVSGAPLTAQELLEEHTIRDEFKRTVERCWRRQTELDDFNQQLQPTYELTLTNIITGDLPAMRADFSHVSLLYLHSDDGLTTGVGRFLERFPRLKELTIRNYREQTLPEPIFRMGNLTSLSMTDCQLTLTAQSALELAQMERLEYLDLSDNPLGVAPDVSQMPHLTTLLLNNTGITELPSGLLQLRSLDTVDLSANAITHIPADILELPLEIAEGVNLRGNPLSAESVQTLIHYFRQTGVDFDADAVIDQAEMEVSSSGGSDADE
ncbi:leucine-rich repeat domain-containing protein [Pseudomonas sp. A-RE-19]|uniref:leucine-rich repeat domain-containing protein n=1 Tax=Pseudomonas sp. A-RE-19 TaxID=2832401 RepID=UPI001CBCAE60|nr:leucine-rich repeat domain-containing protein [Pseudomonas sp. A-RE-19]